MPNPCSGYLDEHIACLHVRSPHILWLSTICNGEYCYHKQAKLQVILELCSGLWRASCPTHSCPPPAVTHGMPGSELNKGRHGELLLESEFA